MWHFLFFFLRLPLCLLVTTSGLRSQINKSPQRKKGKKKKMSKVLSHHAGAQQEVNSAEQNFIHRLTPIATPDQYVRGWFQWEVFLCWVCMPLSWEPGTKTHSQTYSLTLSGTKIRTVALKNWHFKKKMCVQEWGLMVERDEFLFKDFFFFFPKQ